MVILLDSFIAAHRVQLENVEIDFLSILCVSAPSRRMDLAEIQKMPSAAGREEGNSRRFPTETELPFNPGFRRKHH